MPKYLFIHLNRFGETADRKQYSKIKDHLTYPMTLDLDSILPPSLLSLSREFSSPKQQQQPPPLGRFVLRSLINHQGSSLDKGHYFSLTQRLDG